jgi:hypothetical protein
MSERWCFNVFHVGLFLIQYPLQVDEGSSKTGLHKLQTG